MRTPHAVDKAGRGPAPDVLIHPVRLRIVAEFCGRSLTTKDLATALPGIPQASLYRHVGILVEGGVLEIVAERIVNGATERVYRVGGQGARLTAEEIDGLDPEQHLANFAVFTASLVEAFGEYIQHDGVVPSRDGLSYNLGVVHVTDEEFADFAAKFAAISAELLETEPGPGRNRYTIASIVVPDERNHR